jgi:hypothetical protein
MDKLEAYERKHGRGCWSALARAAGCAPHYLSGLRSNSARLPSVAIGTRIEIASGGEIPMSYWQSRYLARNDAA